MKHSAKTANQLRKALSLEMEYSAIFKVGLMVGKQEHGGSLWTAHRHAEGSRLKFLLVAVFFQVCIRKKRPTLILKLVENPQ